VNNEQCRCKYSMTMRIVHLHLHCSLFMDHFTFTFGTHDALLETPRKALPPTHKRRKYDFTKTPHPVRFGKPCFRPLASCRPPICSEDPIPHHCICQCFGAIRKFLQTVVGESPFFRRIRSLYKATTPSPSRSYSIFVSDGIFTGNSRSGSF
jgi:hypothetical protein